MNIKQILFWLHKQAGLWLALFFVILGLTGSALVFMRDIEPVIHADTLLPQKPATYEATNADTALAAFKSQDLAKNFRVLRLYLPSNKDNVFRIVTVNTTKEGRGDFYFHYISPYDATYLGEHLVKTNNVSRWSMPIMRLLLQVHIQLMSGYYGGLLMGMIGLAFFTTSLLGFYLWLPKNWSKAFTISWRSNLTRLMLDLHKQIGFWAGIVLLLITFTGIYHAFPDQFEKVTMRLLPSNKSEDVVATVSVDEPSSIQSYVDYVGNVYPDAQNMQIFLQNYNKGEIELRVSQPGEINVTEGKTSLAFDVTTGALIRHQRPETTPTAKRFINWMLPLHNGEAFGLLGRIIFAFVGLMPLVLFITGFYVFYKKYRAKSQKGVFSFILAVLSPK